MAFANLLVFIFLFLFHLLLESADSAESCPNSFSCGNLGPLEFPLSNMQPDCGLFMVDCDFPIPRIQFQFGGEWYEILRKNSTNSLLVRSPNLQHHLGSSNCFFLCKSISTQLSFKFVYNSPSINLFLCSNESRNQVIDDYFQTYSLHTCPPVFNVLQLGGGGTGDLFSMLTSEFTLDWNVSGDCNDCHRRGGQCTTSNMNGFLCRTENRRTLMLVVTTGNVLLVDIIRFHF
ncbi:hypothetical protein ACJIZ3_020125 [Penstemon smallii]|uniref:Wall-associated receptor kinase C-terminal domain-containing protein n=1 Tax=Penstemon smallii TaxID=265156 RepID=A0ABD3SI49_9LAMI